ncbi:hypothetical protein FACS1894103_6790 [Campylobacterota bacterium]|nr:hypothetical protein FACS1894103_6790 [Campylobacterota bacterium]
MSYLFNYKLEAHNIQQRELVLAEFSGFDKTGWFDSCGVADNCPHYIDSFGLPEFSQKYPRAIFKLSCTTENGDCSVRFYRDGKLYQGGEAELDAASNQPVSHTIKEGGTK